MGANGARSGGGGSGVPDTIRPPKIRRKEVFQENVQKLVRMSPTVRILEGIKKGFEESKRKKQLDYESAAYGTKPMSSYQTQPDRDGGGNQVVQSTTTPSATMTIAQAPTAAEVSQSSATEATDPNDPLYIKRKTKRVGRSLTILTSSKGVEEGLTLGKRTLLGKA